MTGAEERLSLVFGGRWGDTGWRSYTPNSPQCHLASFRQTGDRVPCPPFIECSLRSPENQPRN